MGDLIDMLVKNLSLKTCDMIENMDLSSDSEKCAESLYNLNKNVDNTEVISILSELRIRLKNEELARTTYEKLCEGLKCELENAAWLANTFKSVSKVDEIQSQLESYKKLKDKVAPIPNIDIRGILNLHAANKAKTEQIAKIKERIHHYGDIPADIDEAKIVIKNLMAENNDMEAVMQRSIQNDLSKYLE